MTRFGAIREKVEASKGERAVDEKLKNCQESVSKRTYARIAPGARAYRHAHGDVGYENEPNPIEIEREILRGEAAKSLFHEQPNRSLWDAVSSLILNEIHDETPDLYAGAVAYSSMFNSALRECVDAGEDAKAFSDAWTRENAK